MSISKSKMNVFVKIGLVMALLAVVCFGFVACGGLGTLKDNPSSTDAVYGNGGLAVQKGDYLYFVNGYINTADVGDTNNYGNIDQSAIYRVKLTNGKVVETNPEYEDEDGNIVTDKTMALNDLDIIAPKVAGFEYSNLYIFGDYLYYTSPNHLKDKNLTVQSNYLHFYRVKLNRSGANELLYSTESENSSVSITMYQVENKVYQVILDGQKLVINTINQNGSVTRETVAEDVLSASLPIYKNSEDAINEIDKKIYYTNTPEGFNGTVLNAIDLSSKEKSVVFQQENVTYKIINTNGNYLYYTKKDSTPPSFNDKIYTMDAQNRESASPVSDLFVDSSSSTGIKSYHLVSAHLGKAIMYSDGTSTYLKLASNASGTKIIDSDIISKIVEINSNYVYFIKDSNLYKLDYVTADSTAELVIPEGTTPKSDIANNFDVDGDNIYYLVQYGEHYYLNYVSYDPTTADEYGKAYSHFVGKLLEEDYEE